MADIQGISLYFFIYMCIVQAYSVSTTKCTLDYQNRLPRFHGFISERNELLSNTCWFIFPMEKINQ